MMSCAHQAGQILWDSFLKWNFENIVLSKQGTVLFKLLFLAQDLLNEASLDFLAYKSCLTFLTKHKLRMCH